MYHELGLIRASPKLHSHPPPTHPHTQKASGPVLRLPHPPLELKNEATKPAD